MPINARSSGQNSAFWLRYASCMSHRLDMPINARSSGQNFGLGRVLDCQKSKISQRRTWPTRLAQRQDAS
jgi:hypothetical protein